MLCLAVLFLSAAPAMAQMRVLASVPPVHSLVASVMGETGSPDLVIPGGSSPHGFALRPSQARALAEADVVFWVGPGLETALTRPIETRAKGARVVALSQAEGLVRLPRRGNHDDDHQEGAGKDGDGATADDPHYWLDPENAKVWLRAIAEALSEADPERAEIYAYNATIGERTIDALTAEYRVRLAPLRDQPFAVFHDAYQYLENRFSLNTLGAFTFDPDRPAGVRHVAELRQKVKRLNAVCLFTEPQFPSRLVTSLATELGLRVAELDPLGSRLSPGPDLYGRMMLDNLQAITDCLA